MIDKDIFELMARFEAGTAASFRLTTREFTLELSRGSAAAPAPAVPAAPAQAPSPTPAAEPEGLFITAPLVGTFYAAPAPGEAPFVRPGDAVKQGQTVCLMEAMKMMNEVKAPRDCVIEAVLQQDGALVSFGDPLLRYREG